MLQQRGRVWVHYGVQAINHDGLLKSGKLKPEEKIYRRKKTLIYFIYDNNDSIHIKNFIKKKKLYLIFIYPAV
jgi:hypothetical protein